MANIAPEKLAYILRCLQVNGAPGDIIFGVLGILVFEILAIKVCVNFAVSHLIYLPVHFPFLSTEGTHSSD